MSFWGTVLQENTHCRNVFWELLVGESFVGKNSIVEMSDGELFCSFLVLNCRNESFSCFSEKRHSISLDYYKSHSCCEKNSFPIKIYDRFSKFYWLCSNFLLVKVSPYGFDYNSLEMINSLISGRRFRTEISYSPNYYLSISISQESFKGPFSFIHIYICDILFDC